MVKVVNQAISSQSEVSKDNVKNALSPLATNLSKLINDAEKRIVEFEKTYIKLAAYFGEDPKKIPSEEFFLKIESIWNAYKKVLIF